MLLCPRLQNLHVDSLVVHHWMVFLKQDPLWSRTTQNLKMYLVSLHFLCAAHTLYCLVGYFFFPSPPPKIFSNLCILKSPEILPGGSCLDPRWWCLLLWKLKIIRIRLTSILDYWYPGPSYRVQEVLVLYFLFVFSVLYTKKCVEESTV